MYHSRLECSPNFSRHYSLARPWLSLHSSFQKLLQSVILNQIYKSDCLTLVLGFRNMCASLSLVLRSAKDCFSLLYNSCICVQSMSLPRPCIFINLAPPGLEEYSEFRVVCQLCIHGELISYD